METTNNKINSFQFAALGFMMGNALFVGFGIIIMITLSKQDAWITMLIATLLALIPLAILIYIINYKPEQNIFEKNRSLFGNILGNIINFIMCVFFTIILTLVLWTTTYFSLTQYLTKVPYTFVAIIYILVTSYAVIKGIETIARTNEIALFVSIIMIGFIWISLYSNFHLDQIKPILVNGVNPLFGHALIALSYGFPPLLTLTVIPKNDIINNKKYQKYLIIGFLASALSMAVTFLIIIGVITINLAEIFRYPVYFTQYKIDIAGFFQGVENFLSFHWLLNDFIALMMLLYFIDRYIKDVFKFKKEKTFKIIIVVFSLILAYASNKIFESATAGVEFMKNTFPYYVGIPLFTLVIIISILIFINNRRNKNKIDSPKLLTTSQ